METITISKLNKLYPYSRPLPTIQIFLLGLIVISGLIALFFAAFHAFMLVAEPTQAFFAALVIEAGLIAECLARINKPRSVAPWLGLVISYIVSGTYNYTQAAFAGKDLGGWELGALAFGPLSALAVVSLTFGNELRSYQDQVTTWNHARADWVEGERKRIEQERQQQELDRLKLVQEQGQTRLESEQRHTEKMARIEAKKDVPRVSRKNNGGVPKMSQAEMLKRILEHLEKNGDTHMTQLAEQLGTSRSTLYRRIDELQQAGKVHKNGEGWKVN